MHKNHKPQHHPAWQSFIEYVPLQESRPSIWRGPQLRHLELPNGAAWAAHDARRHLQERRPSSDLKDYYNDFRTVQEPTSTEVATAVSAARRLLSAFRRGSKVALVVGAVAATHFGRARFRSLWRETAVNHTLKRYYLLSYRTIIFETSSYV
jgi:hypothetical protein